MSAKIFAILILLLISASCAEDEIVSSDPETPYIIVENVEGTFLNEYNELLEEARAIIRVEYDYCLKFRPGRVRCTGVDLITPNKSFVNLCAFGTNYCDSEYDQPDVTTHRIGGLPLFWEITGYDTIVGVLEITYEFLDTITVHGQCEIIDYGEYIWSDTVRFVYQN